MAEGRSLRHLLDRNRLEVHVGRVAVFKLQRFLWGREERRSPTGPCFDGNGSARGRSVFRGGQHVHVVFVVVLLRSVGTVVDAAQNLGTHQGRLRDDSLHTDHSRQHVCLQIARTHHVTSERPLEADMKRRFLSGLNEFGTPCLCSLFNDTNRRHAPG